MIIPSIDISKGQAVQLVGGETVAIEAGDPIPWLDRFGVTGEVAVIDIDSARGDGDNRDLISELCRRGRVRVGGGIRDVPTALEWLDLGAEKVIIGTAATPGLLRELPADRAIVALDSRDGEVLTHGWRRSSGDDLMTRVEELRGLCDGFLVTFVELEGRLGGTDVDRAREVITAAAPARVTIAGGISTPEEIAALDRMGADAQVGMALYSGRLTSGQAVAATMRSDRADGLWPTVVTDEAGVALGLVYSSAESLERAVTERRGIYHSRSRGVWVKGETSGATQDLLAVDIDCDRDTLRFTVRQSEPGFCHTDTRTCWGEDHGVGRLERRLGRIARSDDPASNTMKLLADPKLLAAKLTEEASELARAETTAEVIHEAADLLYFLLVRATAAGVELEDVALELDRRERRTTRRPMTTKESLP
ncbi:MAG TPA: phosphoribosyl-ATP diphosphatase [Acidimicrobiia bacterium]|nr:phosphoribosyl-ATP diphosphatase [Acidimicrobiia bacterium]